MLAWWLSAPLLPVSLSVNVPRGVDVVVRIRRVATPGAVTGLPNHDATEPPVAPPTDSVTGPANPFRDATVTVNPAAAPTLTACADGVTVSVKSGGAGTTSVAVTVWVSDPLVPVMVSG